MPTGSVKWYNPAKKYGFITPDAGGADVFVHISALDKAGLDRLQEGERVSYELQENRGKQCAVNLKLAG